MIRHEFIIKLICNSQAKYSVPLDNKKKRNYAKRNAHNLQFKKKKFRLQENPETNIDEVEFNECR